jgi:hypothetical protein
MKAQVPGGCCVAVNLSFFIHERVLIYKRSGEYNILFKLQEGTQLLSWLHVLPWRAVWDLGSVHGSTRLEDLVTKNKATRTHPWMLTSLEGDEEIWRLADTWGWTPRLIKITWPERASGGWTYAHFGKAGNLEVQNPRPLGLAGGMGEESLFLFCPGPSSS